MLELAQGFGVVLTEFPKSRIARIEPADRQFVFGKSTHDGFDLWHPGFASHLSEGLKAPKFHHHSFHSPRQPATHHVWGYELFVPPSTPHVRTPFGEVTARRVGARRRKNDSIPLLGTSR